MSLFDRIIGPAGLAETVVKERGDEAWRDEHARGFTHGHQAAKDVAAKHGRALAHTNLGHLKKSKPESHFDVGYLKGYKHHLGVHESEVGQADLLEIKDPTDARRTTDAAIRLLHHHGASEAPTGRRNWEAGVGSNSWNRNERWRHVDVKDHPEALKLHKALRSIAKDHHPTSRAKGGYHLGHRGEKQDTHTFDHISGGHSLHVTPHSLALQIHKGMKEQEISEGSRGEKRLNRKVAGIRKWHAAQPLTGGRSHWTGTKQPEAHVNAKYDDALRQVRIAHKLRFPRREKHIRDLGDD